MPLKTVFEQVTHKGYVEGAEMECLLLLSEFPIALSKPIEGSAMSNVGRECLAKNARPLRRCNDGSAIASMTELSREGPKRNDVAAALFQALACRPAVDATSTRAD